MVSGVRVDPSCARVVALNVVIPRFPANVLGLEQPLGRRLAATGVGQRAQPSPPGVPIVPRLHHVTGRAPTTEGLFVFADDGTPGVRTTVSGRGLFGCSLHGCVRVVGTGPSESGPPLLPVPWTPRSALRSHGLSALDASLFACSSGATPAASSTGVCAARRRAAASRLRRPASPLQSFQDAHVRCTPPDLRPPDSRVALPASPALVPARSAPGAVRGARPWAGAGRGRDSCGVARTPGACGQSQR